LFLALALTLQEWQASLDAGKAAYVKHDYAEATAQFTAAADAAARTPGNDAAVIDALRLLAMVRREAGDSPGAQQALARALAQCLKAEPNSGKLAGLFEELGSLGAWKGMSTSR
jgi:hypothetical protein